MNNCGHLIDSPILYTEMMDNRPDVLKIAVDKCRQFYFKHKTYLTDLNTLNPSGRQKKSERREAISAVMQVLISYTDLCSFMVGTPTKMGGFYSLRSEFIASKLDIGIKRVNRALKDLVDAGYISTKTKYVGVKEKGIFGIRQIMMKYHTLYSLGISAKMMKTAHYFKINSLRKKEKEARKKRQEFNKQSETARNEWDKPGHFTQKEELIASDNVRGLRHILNGAIKKNGSGRSSLARVTSQQHSSAQSSIHLERPEPVNKPNLSKPSPLANMSQEQKRQFAGNMLDLIEKGFTEEEAIKKLSP